MSIQSAINSMLGNAQRGIATYQSVKALSKIGTATARENRAENAPDATTSPTASDTSSAVPTVSAVAGAVARERVMERFMSLKDTKEAYIEHMRALHKLFQGQGDDQTLKTIRDTQYAVEKEEKPHGFIQGVYK